MRPTLNLMGAGIQADVANAEGRLAKPGPFARRRSACRRYTMSEIRILPLALIALLVAGLPACRNRQAAAAPTTPPPPAVIVGPMAPPPGMVSEPQNTAEIPDADPVPPDAAPERRGPLAGRVEPEATVAAPPPQPQRPAQPVASDERPVSDGTEATAPVPRLGQLLTAEERQAYHRTIDSSIEAARRNLTIILGHTLRPDQAEAVRRIRAFINQAETARERDLALAKNLADRALLLAEDLARSFR